MAGYKKIVIDGRQVAEHRYVMEKHLGRKLLSSELIHHINGNIRDNRVCNLEIMSRKNHAQEHDVLKLGRKKGGMSMPNAILCEGDVQEIRQLIRNGSKCTEISRTYNVSAITIYKIKYRKTWRHVS